MRAKPHTEMQSIGPAVMDQIVAKTGVPDNLVESAVGTLVGLPDIESDPQSRQLISDMHESLLNSVSHSGNGGPSVESDEGKESAPDA